jgi:hypothetical protein
MLAERRALEGFPRCGRFWRGLKIQCEVANEYSVKDEEAEPGDFSLGALTNWSSTRHATLRSCCILSRHSGESS